MATSASVPIICKWSTADSQSSSHNSLFQQDRSMKHTQNWCYCREGHNINNWPLWVYALEIWNHIFPRTLLECPLLFKCTVVTCSVWKRSPKNPPSRTVQKESQIYFSCLCHCVNFSYTLHVSPPFSQNYLQFLLKWTQKGFHTQRVISTGSTA